MLINSLKTYTYKDYLTYDENERIEIIEGEIINMSPAPFDVILKNDDEEIINSKNIVQPDISVICDKNKLTEKGCTGSPDMIVEVISPYNPSNDYVRKLNLYEKFKVKEYWIINPMRTKITI